MSTSTDRQVFHHLGTEVTYREPVTKRVNRREVRLGRTVVTIERDRNTNYRVSYLDADLEDRTFLYRSLARARAAVTEAQFHQDPAEGLASVHH